MGRQNEHGPGREVRRRAFACAARAWTWQGSISGATNSGAGQTSVQGHAVDMRFLFRLLSLGGQPRPACPLSTYCVEELTRSAPIAGRIAK